MTVPIAGTPQSAGHVILATVVVNLLNPKLSIFFVAFLPQFVAADDTTPLVTMAWLGVVFMMLTFAVFAPLCRRGGTGAAPDPVLARGVDVVAQGFCGGVFRLGCQTCPCQPDLTILPLSCRTGNELPGHCQQKPEARKPSVGEQNRRTLTNPGAQKCNKGNIGHSQLYKRPAAQRGVGGSRRRLTEAKPADNVRGKRRHIPYYVAVRNPAGPVIIEAPGIDEEVFGRKPSDLVHHREIRIYDVIGA